MGDVPFDRRGQNSVTAFIEPESVAGMAIFLVGSGVRPMYGRGLGADGYMQKLYWPASAVANACPRLRIARST